jgi:hypothetical protein
MMRIVGGRLACHIINLRSSSVADPVPGSGAFWTPGSDISFFRITDPTYISESLVTIFWVKNT